MGKIKSKHAFRQVPVLWFYFLSIAFLIGSCGPSPDHSKKASPNIVIFYVDDLGYADLSCYGAKGVETPNVDRLAEEGLRFTDAHSSAATCTPSRYSLLTGQYAFRNNAAILPGDAPLLIDPDLPTLPKMLKKAGYTTGVVGKWHLGLGRGEVNWNEEVKPGPLEVGFDYSFLLPSTGDRVPTVYLEKYSVVNATSSDPISISYSDPVGDRPTGLSNPELLKMPADTQHSNTIINGISRIGYMAGGESALWVDEEFPDVFTGKAVDFIETNKEQPFFLFFSFHDIHVPRAPHPRFVGKSEMGPRGDAIVQMDWMTGVIMEALEKNGLDENSLVIFTSDNGPVLDDGYTDYAVEMVGEHNPSGPFRGGKYSAYEAGTRMPTITYWKGRIKAGQNDALWSQVDLYASLAALVNQPLGEYEAIDSEDVLPVILGQSSKGRIWMLEESFTLSLRKDFWKYIAPIQRQKPDWLANKDIEGGFQDTPQLYNLKEDPREQRNLIKRQPDLVLEMQKKLQEIQNRTQSARK